MTSDGRLESAAGDGAGAEQAVPDRESGETQMRGVRERLVREAAAAGYDEKVVDDLIGRAAVGYRDARVKGFVGILIERAVREQLPLSRHAATERDGSYGSGG